MTIFPEVPNLRHLRMVQVIGRLGGVSGAARALGTSQPAVTQALANLEAEIGTPIFERRTTGTVPTAMGTLFLRRIDRFFDVLETAVGQVTSGSERPHSTAPVESLITGTQLRAFVVTSDPAQLTETARQIGLSAASLLRAARTLERTLGCPLYDRAADGLPPNQTGRSLARQFRRAIREIEFGRGEVLWNAGQAAPEVVIGTLTPSGNRDLAEAVHRFLNASPIARVRIITSTDPEQDLSDSKIDMIFGALPPSGDRPGFETEALYRDSYCLLARAGHPLAATRNIHPEDLPGYDWLLAPRGTASRAQMEALFADMANRPRPRMESSSPGMSRALLLSGDMVTLMPQSDARLDASLGILKILPCSHLDATFSIGITTLDDWLPTPAHLLFLTCLRATISERLGHVMIGTFIGEQVS
ncbi:LysR family transcriptional regulator [Pseudooceanicola algae]|uniref:Uncharacterized protein n=1 Tax=Pseudooceanicola algae TaxID=1537215 RepID=A0A418SE12_9RHOB|nr:LysR substrate-binding domain-containing protein [Pseudooceanicola algae]QPM89595.1 hypothetical protein PSAL_008160 [Pseudooceanicola algae]